MKVKILRSVGNHAYTVGIGENMTMDIISIIRSKFRERFTVLTAMKTGYMDESEFYEKHRTQTLEERARSFALFREQQEQAKREAYLETCVTGWDVPDVPFSIQSLKDTFLAEENIHQVDDLIALSSQEELFWIKEEKEAEEQVKKS